MFRKLILTCALSVAALAGIAAVPSTAEAHPIVAPRARFEVLVRHRGHWDSHGFYANRADARRAARHLRQHGFEVRIERR